MNKQRQEYLKELKAYGIKNNIPNVSETGGQFLHFLVGLKKPKKVLEVGMANGYSSIWLADALEQFGGNLVCYDFSKNTVLEAIENFKKCNLTNIEIRKTNPLRDPIPDNEKYDMIFIDSQKGFYHECFEQIIKKHLAPEGFAIFDDVLKFPEKTKKFNEVMEKDTDYEKVVLPIDEDDGVLMMQLINKYLIISSCQNNQNTF